eukprot:gene14258-16830_t
MGRDDIPVYAGDSYSVVEVDSGTYGCQYTKNVPLYPGGKDWPDTVMGLNHKYWPKPKSDDRSYYPDFPTAVDNIPQLINQTAANREIIFVSLAPFSTVHRLLTNTPWIKSRVSHIYAMGGAVFVPGNLFFPFHNPANNYSETNIYSDPQAAYTAFQSGIPMTLIPIDATNSFDANNLTYIQTMFPKIHKEEARLCYDILYRMYFYSKGVIFRNSVWDVLAISAMINPSFILQSSIVNITVITNPPITSSQPNQVGRLSIDNINGKPITVVTSINSQALFDYASTVNKP